MTDKSKQGQVDGNLSVPPCNLTETSNQVKSGVDDAKGSTSTGPSPSGATTVATPVARGLSVDVMLVPNAKNESPQKLGILKFVFLDDQPEIVQHFTRICPLKVKLHEIEPNYVKFSYQDLAFPVRRSAQPVASTNGTTTTTTNTAAAKDSTCVKNTITKGSIAVLGYTWLLVTETTSFKLPWRPIASLLHDDSSEELMKEFLKRKKAFKAFVLNFSMSPE